MIFSQGKGSPKEGIISPCFPQTSKPTWGRNPLVAVVSWIGFPSRQPLALVSPPKGPGLLGVRPIRVRGVARAPRLFSLHDRFTLVRGAILVLGLERQPKNKGEFFSAGFPSDDFGCPGGVCYKQINYFPWFFASNKFLGVCKYSSDHDLRLLGNFVFKFEEESLAWFFKGGVFALWVFQVFYPSR